MDDLQIWDIGPRQDCNVCEWPKLRNGDRLNELAYMINASRLGLMAVEEIGAYKLQW